MELKIRELKDREVKIKREIEELFSKPIVVSIEDIDKFEQEEMKKLMPIKNTSYDWLVNYIPEAIIKILGSSKDKIASFFNTNTPKQIVYWRGKKLCKPKIQNVINNIRNPFMPRKKKKKL